MRKSTTQAGVPVIHQTIDDVQVYEALRSSYQQYSEYIARGRALINIDDGFKSVQRRILYGAYEICRKNNVKSATLDGHVMGHYHPHGMCYGSIVNMVHDGYLIGKGNWGSTLGVDEISPAASRYTEVRLNPLSELLFLNDLLPYVDWVDSDTGYKEPKFLPALVPGLLTSLSNTSEFNTAMGVHIKSVYGKSPLVQILDAVIAYLESGKFPQRIAIQYKNSLVAADCFDKHKFSVVFGAIVEEDRSNVHIRSTLPNVSYRSLFEDNGISYKDVGTSTTDIVIPKRQYDPDLFTSKVDFSYMAYHEKDEQTPVTVHAYSLKAACLRLISNMETILYPRYFETNINKVSALIAEYDMLERIRHRLDTEPGLTYKTLSAPEQDVAKKYSVASMMHASERCAEYRKQLKDLEHRQKNIRGEILARYKYVRSCLS